MTEFATIEAQETQILSVTANTLTTSPITEDDNSYQKYSTGVFITELVAKASELQDMEKRTDAFLYGLLQDCYEDFQVLNKQNSNLASQAQAALAKYCEQGGMKFGKEAKLLGKLMNCVFKGADRSKISTYSYVIKYAVKEQIAKGQLAAVIKRMGGIQRIKVASFVDVVAKAKAKHDSKLQQAQTSVQQTNMGTVDVPSAASAISKLSKGAQVVLIATINEERKFVIRGATSDENVVKAAVLALAKPKSAVTESNAALSA